MLRGTLRLPHRADLPALMAVGVFQLGGYFALAHEAVAWVPAGRTAVLANTTTIWVVPLSLIFLHERIPLRRWLAAGLGLVGVVVLMSPWAIDWTSHNILVGHVFLLGAALSWSVAIIVTRAATTAFVDVRVVALVFCGRCGDAGTAAGMACAGWQPRIAAWRPGRRLPISDCSPARSVPGA